MTSRGSGRLLRLRVALVALERPDGLLIERLLDAGVAVVAVHPNQVKAMRPRFSVAGGKRAVNGSGSADGKQAMARRRTKLPALHEASDEPDPRATGLEIR